jgi:hypothetical protein
MASWWTLLGQLNAYDEDQGGLDENLVKRLKALKKAMTEGIGNVNTKAQLKAWTDQMLNDGYEVFMLLEFTAERLRKFAKDGRALHIGNVVRGINDKIEGLIRRRDADIAALKGEFTAPATASTPTLHAVQSKGQNISYLLAELKTLSAAQ